MRLRQHGAKPHSEQRAAEYQDKRDTGNCEGAHDFSIHRMHLQSFVTSDKWQRLRQANLPGLTIADTGGAS
jgi:hypothetical protein